ncbi:hypothetical protein [uncultured Flavobacterium sp.]|uniref:hypothetical protein n=1 Tax=uncultured Flavobacterium sp. TaxID=165435 RepID=UPI0030C7AE12
MKIFISFILINIFSFSDYQERKVSGIIYDSESKPIPNLKIKCKVSKDIHYTDLEGKFKFDSRLGEQLIIKYKKHKKLQVTVSTKENYIIRLQSRINKDEIIIIN